MGFYIESADRPHQSRPAAEDIHVGLLVAENGSDKVRLADDADSTRWDGVADAPRSAEYIAPEVDQSSDFTYSASDDERVPYGGRTPGDIIKVRTIQDNGTDPAPSISDGDIVGFVDSSAVSDTAAEFKGRIVETGYQDDAPTTFDEGSNNFVKIGVAYRDSSSGFDEVVRVQVRDDI